MTQSVQPAFLSEQVEDARRFYRDVAPGRGRALRVVCGGCERCTTDYLIQRRDFPYLSVEYVARGRGTLTLRGRPHPLGPGSVFAYGPRVPHRIVSEPANPLVKYFVDFTGRAGERLLAEGPLRPGELLQVARPAQLRDIFDLLIENGLSDTAQTPRLCATLVELLVLKINETALPPGTGSTRALASYQRCRDHLEAHYLELRTVEQLAARCHVDTAYLCRLFQRFDHHSPYQILTRLKMNRAAELLRHSGRLVKQVGDELGFADPYHFSRVFKKVYGVAPESFLRAGRR